MNDGPLIVQSDKTLLLEVDHEMAAECRKAIAPFAELERSPEHVHTYRLTPLGLWNARAAGHDAEQVVDTLLSFSRYAVPHALLVDIAETMARYGRLRLEKHPVHGLVLSSTDRPVLEEVLRAKKVKPMLGDWEVLRIASIHALEHRSWVELAVPGRVGSLFPAVRQLTRRVRLRIGRSRCRRSRRRGQLRRRVGQPPFGRDHARFHGG